MLEYQMNELFVVGLPIGNLEDITLRALRILNEVDYILTEDTREFYPLAKHYNITKPLKSYHKFNENLTEKIIEDLKYKKIALVSDRGMPTISDPGALLIQRALNTGYKVTVIPGASALSTSLPYLNHKEHIFVGFCTKLEDYKKYEIPLIFFESPKRIYEFLNKTYQVLGNRKITICRELTKMHEEILVFENNNIPKFEEKGEFVVIVHESHENFENYEKDVLFIKNFNNLTEKDRKQILKYFRPKIKYKYTNE